VIVAETELVTFRSSSIHGVGGFARLDLEAGKRVLEYVGERITKRESLERCQLDNRYIFALDNDHDLDGSVSWNSARYLNHSCAPNCEALSQDEGIWIFAERRIKAGEEITFNYGYDLEDYREHPCVCGAPNCVGYMVAEEFFAHVTAQKRIGDGQRA
jgi:SET domain-containing protein